MISKSLARIWLSIKNSQIRSICILPVLQLESKSGRFPWLQTSNGIFEYKNKGISVLVPIYEWLMCPDPIHISQPPSSFTWLKQKHKQVFSFRSFFFLPFYSYIQDLV